MLAAAGIVRSLTQMPRGQAQMRWTLAVDRNQYPLGKTMLVANRPVESVPRHGQTIGPACTARSYRSLTCTTVCSSPEVAPRCRGEPWHMQACQISAVITVPGSLVSMPARVPRPLRDGDSIALLAPASNADDEWVDRCVDLVRDWRFEPRLGAHVRERHGYMAGTDAARLEDLNRAIRDPAVRAIVTLRGGCGSFRLVHGIDLDALKRDPKLLVGFSDITALHLAWNTAGVATLHGPLAGDHVEDVRMLLTGQIPGPIVTDPEQFGAELTTHGVAAGPLIGGNLEMLARSVGVLDLDLRGHIVLLELNRAAGLGMVDRALSQLLMSGTLRGVQGVALGHLQGFEDYVDRGWTVIDVLRERLAELAVPILSGLPLGHAPSPRIVPMGTDVVLDADTGRLVPRLLA